LCGTVMYVCCLFREAEEKTSDDSAAAATPSVPVSPKDPTDAPSQLIPVVSAHTHTHTHTLA